MAVVQLETIQKDMLVLDMFYAWSSRVLGTVQSFFLWQQHRLWSSAASHWEKWIARVSNCSLLYALLGSGHTACLPYAVASFSPPDGGLWQPGEGSAVVIMCLHSLNSGWWTHTYWAVKVFKCVFSLPRHNLWLGWRLGAAKGIMSHLDCIIVLLVAKNCCEEVPEGELRPQHLLETQTCVRALQNNPYGFSEVRKGSPHYHTVRQ